MATAKTTWYKLPQQAQEIVSELIYKIEESNCFDTTTVENIKTRLTWFNTPSVIEEVIEYLKELNYPTSISKPRWYKLPNSIDKLRILVQEFDCSKVNISEDISYITLQEYDSTGDLTEPNTNISINVYFDDVSGDEIPNIGTTLYTNPTQRTIFTGESGAYYFVKPSDPDTQISLSIDDNGVTTDTGFDSEEPLSPVLSPATNTTATTTDLSWEASTDNEEVTSYNIYQDGVLKTENVTTTSTTVTGLTTATTYNFTVTALDSSGNESDPSNSINVTTL